MMKLARESIETSLDNTEENEAKFILHFFRVESHQTGTCLCEKNEISWNEDTDQEEEIAGYMG